MATIHNGKDIITSTSRVGIAALMLFLLVVWNSEVTTTPNFRSDSVVARTENVSKQAVELERLTLVSMNMAGCNPSAEAPSGWDQKIACQTIQAEVLKGGPDVLFLQEYPYGEAQLKEQFGSDYQVMGVTSSHADRVALLVRKGIEAQPWNIDSIPAVMASVQYGAKNRKLLVASVHLAYSRQGSYEREAQIDRLVQEASLPLVFAGDTNMRETEDEAIERKGLTDAWKMAGSDPKTRFTWDTIDHTTTDSQEGTFNRYYGWFTRQKVARYDRIYCSNASSSGPTFSVESFELIANTPVTTKYHFLSDHFGISAVLNLQWGT